MLFFHTNLTTFCVQIKIEQKNIWIEMGKLQKSERKRSTKDALEYCCLLTFLNQKICQKADET